MCRVVARRYINPDPSAVPPPGTCDSSTAIGYRGKGPAAEGRGQEGVREGVKHHERTVGLCPELNARRWVSRTFVIPEDNAVEL